MAWFDVLNKSVIRCYDKTIVLKYVFRNGTDNMLERIHGNSTNVTLVNVRVADVRAGGLSGEGRVYIEDGVIRDMDASGGGGAVID